MANPHEALGRFFDGELQDSEVDGFRQHLATCQQCQVELDELMQLDVLGTRHLQLQALKAPRVVRLKPVRRPAWLTWASAGVALAATVVLVVNGLWKTPVPDSVWAPGGDQRLTPARSSYSRAAQYHKYEGLLGPGDESKLPPLPVEELAKIGKDHLGKASAYLVRGDRGGVENALSELKSLSSPEADSERAMAHLNRGDVERLDYEEALRLTDRALQLNPKLGPALWNRALALQNLGLTMLAAKTFDEVAQLDEQGWSTEARQRAEELRSAAVRVRDAWSKADEAAKGLVKGGSALPPDAVRAPASRSYFYDAVQSRRSADEVLALLPLADQLDEQSSGAHLHDYVKWVAARGFERRKAVADQFRRLALENDELVIPGLWKSGEDDIAVSALFRRKQPLTDPELADLEQRARKLKDPWFEVLALQKRAEHLESSDLGAARGLLEKAVQVAEASRLPYRSIESRIDLITVLLRASELEAARAEAAKAWGIADRTGDWHAQRQVIELLAQMARLRRDAPVARAYFGESVERSREDHNKDHERSVREMLGMLEAENLRFKVAREQMDGAVATGSKLSVVGASVLADLARQLPSPADRLAMDGFRTTLDGMPPGRRALATEIIGRWTLEVDPAEGRKLLRDAIAQVGAMADLDADASRARSFAYSALIMDAARQRDFSGVLALFGEEAGVPFPGACAVALNINMERRIAVVRGPAGELDAEYEGARQEPLPDRLDQWLPARLVKALNGCREVKVVARPPLFGRLGALPNTVPWSYALLSRSAAPPPATVPGQGKHLVVQSVAVPARFQRLGLQVPRPLIARHPYPNDLSVLEGAEATPSRIMVELKTASDVDFDTHSVVNPVSGEAFLVVAEGPEGDTLTATQIRGGAFQNQPIVMLSACNAAHSAPVLYEPRSLPAAFLLAGARAVFAADEKVPETEGPLFFNAVRKRIREGVPPAVALRDVRQTLLAEGKVNPWVESVLLFE